MDSRYGCLPQHPCDGVLGEARDSDPSVWVLTWIEALIDAPLCYLAFVAYLRGWAIRRPVEIVIATSHIIGTLMFMGPEIYKGLTHVPPPPNNVGGPAGWFQFLVSEWTTMRHPAGTPGAGDLDGSRFASAPSSLEAIRHM